jgi:hypothetical protein
MQRAAFVDYLKTQHRGRGGRTMPAKPASDCASRAKRVEAILGLELDAALLTEGLRELLMMIDLSDAAAHAKRDCAAALTRYAEFVSHQNREESKRKNDID